MTTDARRAQQTSLIGMAVFLGGWTMLFAALLFVWADVRLTAGAWPPDGEPRAPLLYPAVATLLMAASSWTLARGRRAATLMLGTAFVAVQLVGWAALWRSGVTPSSGRYGSIVYAFCAFHALHVLVGLGGLLLARATLRNWRLFWHFVGAVWLVLFLVLFVAGCSSEETRGRDVYNNYCRACHGENGDGHGYSSPGLRPPPRDFTQGLFKFGHVPLTEPFMPPDGELERIVKKGLNGTAMLPWDLSDGELHAVVQHLKRFSPRWQTVPVGKAIEASGDPFGPARVDEAVKHGKETFEKVQCGKCHEQRELRVTEFCLRWKAKDDCAIPVKVMPPNLQCDPLKTVYRGSELTDLYRTIASGVGGSGMPTWKGYLPEADLWGLAYYVRALRSDQTGCKPSRTGQ